MAEKHMLLVADLRFMSRGDGDGFWGALLCFEFFSPFIFIIILSRKVDCDVIFFLRRSNLRR